MGDLIAVVGGKIQSVDNYGVDDVGDIKRLLRRVMIYGNDSGQKHGSVLWGEAGALRRRSRVSGSAW
ncbi:hypothetical protein [Larsenimonas salina]|uniref:hypothetical protein n=1 Tax=Larsenimonas salina TaxID=1295565 RepID=UPI0020738EB1|nr:hypothetical protein [Larsenimonas salina]MCM5705213.1 hypothetical protein [Larsenimonas salina]